MKKILRNKHLIALGVLSILIASGSVAASTNNRQSRKDLTDEQKQAIEEIWALRDEGKTDEAKALAESVGLPMVGPRGMGGEMSVHREEVDTALQNADYQAFVEATKDAPFADNVNEDFFAKMTQIYNLKKAGDFEGARVIMDEIGIGGNMGHMKPSFEKRGRMNNLTDEQKAKIKEARDLRQSGDTEGARKIMDEIGLRPGFRL